MSAPQQQQQMQPQQQQMQHQPLQHQPQPQQHQQQPAQQQPQQPQPDNSPHLPVPAATRYVGAAGSRLGALFWPQLQPQPQAQPRKRKRPITEEDEKLEAELGLARTRELVAEPAAAAKRPAIAVTEDGTLSPSATRQIVSDALPSTRAAAPPPARGEPPRTLAATEEGVQRGLLTEELTCLTIRPAAAAMLQRLGFGRAHARALDELSDMTSAYLHQLTLAMRRCHDSRVEQAMASPPDGGPVAAPHALDVLQDALGFCGIEPPALLRYHDSLWPPAARPSPSAPPAPPTTSAPLPWADMKRCFAEGWAWVRWVWPAPHRRRRCPRKIWPSSRQHSGEHRTLTIRRLAEGRGLRECWCLCVQGPAVAAAPAAAEGPASSSAAAGTAAAAASATASGESRAGGRARAELAGE